MSLTLSSGMQNALQKALRNCGPINRDQLRKLITSGPRSGGEYQDYMDGFGRRYGDQLKIPFDILQAYRPDQMINPRYNTDPEREDAIINTTAFLCGDENSTHAFVAVVSALFDAAHAARVLMPERQVHKAIVEYVSATEKRKADAVAKKAKALKLANGTMKRTAGHWGAQRRQSMLQDLQRITEDCRGVYPEIFAQAVKVTEEIERFERIIDHVKPQIAEVAPPANIEWTTPPKSTTTKPRRKPRTVTKDADGNKVSKTGKRILEPKIKKEPADVAA